MPSIRPIVSVVVVAILAFFGGLRTTAAEVIEVPSQAPTIQGAIDLAVAGDTVLVAPGTYFETIDFRGKAITVTSEAGPETTIIDGGNVGTVVSFHSAEGPNSVIRGFTIQNGNGGSYDAGGIDISQASPTVEDNRIVNNVGCKGIGITSYFSSPIIQRNTISGNVQTSCSGGSGGGIYVGGASNAQILDNVISDNVVTSGHGGGVYLSAAGPALLRGNLITGNSASGISPGSRGGGISIINQAGASIIANVIVGNSADQGAGIYWSSRGPILINNTIADNDARKGLGSAISATGFFEQTLLFNNVIAAAPGQPAFFCDYNDFDPAIIQHNNVFSASGLAYDGTCTDQTGSNGNISSDPMFADPTNSDYQLGPNSQSIDAGDDTRPEIPPADFNGMPRFFDGDNDGFPTVDMGAFEFQDQPVANAGLDRTVRDFETVNLDGSGSFDPLGGTLSFLWTLDGAEIAAMSQVTVGPFAAGTYTFALTVTDQDSNSATDIVVLTVLPPNQPPVANAGPDQTVNYAQSVSLNGAGSYDPEGDALTYVWSLDGAQIATGPTPTVGPFAVGTYTIVLNVTDVEGDTGTDTMALTVINEPPIADAGPDQTIRVLQTATLTGLGSIDPEDGPITYRWTLDGAEVGNGPTPTVGPFDIGLYTITLTVTDQEGANGSATMLLTVLPPNEPPVAAAVPDQTVLDTGYVYLNGSGSFDPDGTYVTHEWSLDGTTIATGPYPVVGPFPVGTYTITLTVTDAEGASASETMLLTVEPAPPIAYAGQNQSVRVTQSATLDGTWSYDPTGGPLTFSWTLDGTEIATGPTPTVGPFDIGTYTIILTVTDQDGLTDSDSMVLTVLPPNQPPLANAGADQTVTDLETVVLNGTASSDPDGTFLSYAWREGGTQIAVGAAPTVGPFAAGVHTITLAVTDADGATATDTMILTVHQPPVANAGDDLVLSEFDSATLDGSASSDPEGGPLTYLWTLDGTELATGVNPTVGPFALGLQLITLTVTDQEGASSSDTITLAVVPSDQEPVDIPGATRVPLDHPNIQSAIDASLDGDTVLVSPGIYYENINFHGAAITVISEFGPQVTIVDGAGAGSVVTFSSGEGPGSVLEAFTVRNGNAGDGAGIYISNSSPKVLNNTIIDNRGCSGIGISSRFSSPVIQGNTIRDNRRSGCSGGIGGGGVSIGGASSAQLLDNVISDNVITSGHGGGVSLFAAGTPIIRGNVISGNSVSGISPAAHGGGISMVNVSDALIVNNVITGNHADEGGGVYWLVPSSGRGPYLVNNTIADNDAPLGSAVAADGYDAESLLVNNNLIGSPGQPALYCGDFNDLNSPIIRSNNVISPLGAAYGGTCSDQTGIDGNVSADPLFADPDGGDYSLQVASPLVDAGDNSAPDLPDTDFDGGARIFDGDSNGVSVIDIGAFEFQDVPVADAGPNQTVNVTDIVMLDGSASFNPGGGLLSYLWKLDGVEIASAETAEVGPIAAGSYTVTLTVTNQSDVEASDSFTLTVAPSNLAPVADAGPDQTANHAQMVTLDGSGSSDPDGTIASYIWSLGGTQIATGPNPDVGPFAVGAHIITLTVTDDQGASATDTVTVTVFNEDPVADAGPDQTVTASWWGRTTVTLDGTASSDPEDGIVSYVWTQSGQTVGTGAIVTTRLSRGVYTFTLTVTDDQGATSSDSVVVTVNRRSWTWGS